jgi:predicted lipid-binding transport protein (Tim44 family)
MVKEFAARQGAALRSLAAIGGTLATGVAVVLGAVMAIFAAATVAVIAVMASALLAFAGLAMRARRTSRARKRPQPDLIEARHLGGHHWVAYGWNERS